MKETVFALMLGVASLALGLARPVAAGAQNNARIQGVVTDQAGTPLPGVRVTLNGPQGSGTASSDEGGRYKFLWLPPGAYTLTFELAGFQTVVRARRIAPNFSDVVDVKMPMRAPQPSEARSGKRPEEARPEPAAEPPSSAPEKLPPAPSSLRQPGGQGEAARQAPEPARVENVRSEAGGGGVVFIDYDLVARDPAVDLFVVLEVSPDGGRTIDRRAQSVSGDVGIGVRAGVGKRIVWSAARDVETLRVKSFTFRVIIRARPVPPGASQPDSPPSLR